MTVLSREVVLGRLKQLPALPSAVSTLLLSFADDDVDVDRVAGQIARDQGLAARVLRVANSSFYGLPAKVGSIHEAVVMLGFRAVRSLVLAVGINGVFRVDHCPGFDLQAYQRHGVGTGLAARRLAQRVGWNADLAFTAGLLHDIGQLILAANFPVAYAAALAYRQEHDCFLVVAERDVLAIDHGEVGGMLADTWRFPAFLREAVTEHHHVAAATADSLVNIVHLADVTAHALGLSRSPDEMVMPMDPVGWQRMGLSWADYGRLLAAIEQEVDATCSTLTG